MKKKINLVILVDADAAASAVADSAALCFVASLVVILRK